MNSVTLKISISPRDSKILDFLLPHQIKIWYSQVDEILIVLDRHGFDSVSCTLVNEQVQTILASLNLTKDKIRLIKVDYSKDSMKKVSDIFFNGKNVPVKTHRYGPYYAYFYGIYHAKYNYILNLDCDIFFGGSNSNWVNEAIELLNSNEQCITCSPFPGPPTAKGILLDQNGQMDSTSLRKVEFHSISTRIFFINRQDFIKQLSPIPIKIAKWPLLFKALLRRKPIYELPEDTITEIMESKNLKRIDFLGSGEGIWTLHPPFRNETFYENLYDLVQKIENGDVPEAQRGYYDINDSMINWSDAREIIKNASIKRKLFNLLSFK